MTSPEAHSSSDRGSRIIGIIGILLGVFTILALVSFFVIPAPPTNASAMEQQLSKFNANQSAYAFYWATLALACTFLIAFAGGFSRIVRQKSPSVSSAAALLVAAGALTLAIDESVYIGSLFAISAGPSTAAYTTDATYLAAVVSGLEIYFSYLSVLLAGIGVVLFAWLIWKGEMFPRWLPYAVLVGGLLFIVQALPWPLTVPPIFVAGAFVLVAVWGLVAGAALIRTKSMIAEPAK